MTPLVYNCVHEDSYVDALLYSNADTSTKALIPTSYTPDLLHEAS